MRRSSRWVSAGLLTAGVSAGLLTGAGVAAADSGSPAPSGSATSSTGSAEGSGTGTGTTAAGTPGSTDKTEPTSNAGTASETNDPPKKKKKKRSTSAGSGTSATDISATRSEPGPKAESTGTGQASAAAKPAESTAAAAIRAVAPTTETLTPNTSSSLRLAQAPVTARTAPTAVNPVKVIARAVTGLVNSVGSVIINAVQALEKFVTGPPVLPAGSTVTVRTSTILLTNGQRVQANWYYPEPDPDTGAPPEKMILLQHGFFALAPMYSYTAANLAERTNSVVVTPTLSSNFFAGDDHWLGGAGMAAQIADLFTGNRQALTQSAIAAGYATRYGLDPATAALPQKFALAGHSAGGGLVSGAAGDLATNGAAKDLVGVILLDGVPTGNTLRDALTKLDTYQANGGQYIPIRVIGAPPNLFNFISTENQTLSAARPGQFNGVVLSGGVHMDSMQGGNPIIQFAAQLLAGFPQPQNPPAVQDLMTDWMNAWFAGADEGPAPVPGTVIDIDTPKGTAHGRVIGTVPVTTSAAAAALAG
ncbi:hypothetical protein SAMN02799620_04629 [Mycolicibacterium fluoranthenivorans]|uniref:Alpha/beta hydrolase n=1 Tax=Mycolicibacterium fluoranthenivorans TaxID=258505 RepID=A0A1G4WU07_9MYCO|nr:hypothetical protein SAMN02799620_04629 [Mycolicibacterium fluoranthenivorans]